jgi:MFS transporter, putative metabolite:H+ symporter
MRLQILANPAVKAPGHGALRRGATDTMDWVFRTRWLMESDMEASGLTESAVTGIAARLERLPLTWMHVLAASVCAVGFGMDLAEVSLGNALSAVFSAPPYRLASLPLAWVLSGVYAGAVIGSALLGWVAQRSGLKRTLQWALLWLAASSWLVAGAADPAWLGAFRLLSGLALGAYPPLMIAYLTEIAPRKDRGTLIFLACAVAYLVPPAAVFMIRWLTPIEPFGIEGWRWPFLFSGLFALAAGAAFALLPESPHWLRARGSVAAADSAIRAFERSGILRLSRAESKLEGRSRHRGTERRLPGRKLQHPFPFVSGIYFLHPWATIAFPLLTGPVLLARGMGLTNTLLYVGAAAVGPAVGTLCAGLFVDRLDRRAVLIGCAALMLAAVITFFAARSPVLLLSAVVAFGIGVALYSPAMTLYGAELFPTRSRASTTASAWALNRVASVLVPVLLLPVLHTHGPLALSFVVGAALVASALLIGLLGPAGAAGIAVE